jgi:large subunit ribosomal protein L13
MYTQRSFVLKPADAKKKWYIVDAKDKIVGRLATEVANLLRGKNNPKFTANTDSGDHVVVINAGLVKFTGDKWKKKEYRTHAKGSVGHLRIRTAQEQLVKHPELIVYNAVKGMLPPNHLGREQMTKLKVYVGADHPHASQSPQEYKI